MEMNGGSSAPYLARTPCVPFCFVLCLIGVETEGLFRLPGAGGDHFHCTVEPSPGHIWCRHVSTFPKNLRVPPDVGLPPSDEF